MNIEPLSGTARVKWLLRWRARNARSWAEWHFMRARERFGRSDVYTDDFWDFHAGGDWDGLARAILAEVPSESVLDVGCGAGNVLAAFSRVQPGIRTVGLEHSPAARARAAAAGVMALKFDAARLRPREREAWRRCLGPFDLVTCFEVAEHVPPRHGRRLVALLAGWPRVLFTAARPNQGGTLHVNEQPIEYWVRRFARAGLSVSPQSERLRERIAAVNVPWWYWENLVLFERRGGAR